MEIQKINFTDDLDHLLLPVLNSDLEAIKHEVNNNISELWQIDETSYSITRLENDHNGNPFELVFIAGIGKNAHEAIELFIEKVKPMGVTKFRIHSHRIGMGRYLKSLGFTESETVYKRVDCEQ
ncbi:MAG: hypothetical protein ISEC1_P1938 [Thiomicrorhabdus sp.]|nr:MAG: hypothetical protein ISEC1_P1938 [Thiomicrorhabdus sp.]